MNFYDFLKKSLNYPLCYLSVVFDAFFKAISSSFDLLVSNAYELKKEFSAYETKNISKYIKERGIKSIKNESTDNLILRTKEAFRFYTKVGNRSEVEAMVRMMTDKPFHLELAGRNAFYVGRFTVGGKISGESFTYILRFTEIMTEEEKEIIYDTLKEYIRAYLGLFVIALKKFEKFNVGTTAYVGKIKI